MDKSSGTISTSIFSLSDPKADCRRLIQAFLGGLNPNTLRSYQRSLEDFRNFLEADDAGEAVAGFLSKSAGEANSIILSYRNHLIKSGKSPASVNARLAAVRSLVKLARTLGVVSWQIEIKGLRSDTYRDTRGPGREAFDRVVSDLEKKNDPRSIRDLAILRLLHDIALRRGEVAALDISDVDLVNGKIRFMGKGRLEDEEFTLPDVTREALRCWIEKTGRKAGPLFTNFDPAGKGNRLTGTSIYRIVRGYGLSRPHGLRHTAITEALDITDGNVRAVQKFSRHRDVRVIERYDDNRKDLAGEIAKAIADRRKV
jgi:integrase/recombinase XerC